MKKIKMILCFMCVSLLFGCDTIDKTRSDTSLKDILTIEEDIIVEYTILAIEELNANSYIKVNLLQEFDEKDMDIYYNSWHDKYEVYSEDGHMEFWCEGYSMYSTEYVTAIYIDKGIYNVFDINIGELFSDVPRILEEYGYIRCDIEKYDGNNSIKYRKGDIYIVVYKDKSGMISEISVCVVSGYTDESN